MADELNLTHSTNKLEPAPDEKFETRKCDYDEVRISPLNPRLGVPASELNLIDLTASIRQNGQVDDAVALLGSDGVPEVLAGSRRREACRELGRPLRVKVFAKLSVVQAANIAFLQDEGASGVSFWSMSTTYERLLVKGLFASQAELADHLGVDKSTICRAVSLQKAPEALLELWPSRHDIKQDHWFKLAPTLTSPDERARVLEMCVSLKNAGVTGSAAVSSLLHAAANTAPAKPVLVTTKSGAVVASIIQTKQGGYKVMFKPLKDQHPAYRSEHIKLTMETLQKVVKEQLG